MRRRILNITIGGIAELKWIAEYADLHSIQIAPYGTFDGLIGVAAQVLELK
jgi:L-alanine-DL-glutamate epimerase-like enolase superfamily enzyme